MNVDDVVIVHCVIHIIRITVPIGLAWQICFARIARKECINQKGWSAYPGNRRESLGKH